MISSKLASVGVNTGSSDREISFSSNALRRMEVDRLTVIPKVSAFSCTTYDDDADEEVIATSQLLSHLIGEVSDMIMDVAKSRSCSSKKGKKPKKRKKVSPSAIVSQ
jgi:hypothetical protein